MTATFWSPSFKRSLDPALDNFDSINVTPTSHVPKGGQVRLADAYRGTTPGGPPRPNNYETDIFWSVYVTTGYEGDFTVDLDPDNEGAYLGATTGGIPDVGITVMFLETIRDQAAKGFQFGEADFGAAATVHEIGHQFDIAAGPNVVGEHRLARDFPLNIMSPDMAPLLANQFYLYPLDIVALRERVHSPGINP